MVKEILLNPEQKFVACSYLAGLLSNKVTIDIDFVDEKSFWKDNRLKTDDGKLKKFNTGQKEILNLSETAA